MLLFKKVFHNFFGNIRKKIYICVNFTKSLGVTEMMSYRKMLHTATNADSFEKNNILATYNVFTSILGNEKGV
jgi:hypothetical protein